MIRIFMTDLTAKSPDLSVFHSHSSTATAELALAQSTPNSALMKYVFFAMVHGFARDRLRVEEEARRKEGQDHVQHRSHHEH
jgi:hypothetical protein